MLICKHSFKEGILQWMHTLFNVTFITVIHTYRCVTLLHELRQKFHRKDHKCDIAHLQKVHERKMKYPCAM